MQRRHGRSLVRLLVLSLTLALVLAACGSDESPADADGDAAGTGGDTSPDTDEDDGDGQAANGETQVLRFATHLPPGPSQAETHEWWGSELEERTDGAYRVEFGWSAAFVPAVEQLSSAGTGLVDMAIGTSAYSPAELPLMSIAELPLITSDPRASALALRDLLESSEAFQREWEQQGVKVMNFMMVSPAALAVQTPINTLEDLEGQRIRSFGHIDTALEAAGATPVGMQSVDVYESIQRGSLDGGGGLTLDVIPALSLHEVVDHVVYTGLGVFANGALVMSLDTWESLSPDVQQIIEDLNAESYEMDLENLVRTENEACETLTEADVSISSIPDEEVDRWVELLEGRLVEDWLGRAGEGAQEFLDEYLSLIEQHEQGSEYVVPFNRPECTPS